MAEVAFISDTEKISERKSGKRYSGGTDHHGGFDTDLHGVCADRGTACGLRAVWFCTADPVFCGLFHLAAVYFRRRCSACGACRFRTAFFGNRKRFRRSDARGSGFDIICGTLAVCLFLYESRKACQLYFRACDGRFYHRDLYNDHFDAGTEALWWQRRCGRVF